MRGTDDIALLGRSFNDMAGSLQRQFRRLEELSRVQRRFTSDVSHELRTPLTTIRMAAEVLHAERGDFAPELARSVELLLTELDRFESLLADLLEISRYDAGAANLEAEVLDLRGVVSNAVDASRVLAQRHGSELVGRSAPTSRSRSRWTRAGSSGSCATCSATRSTTARAGRWSSPSARATTRSRSPCAITASGCGRARPAWCSTGSGAATRRAAG